MGDARFDRVPSENPLVGLVLRAYCLALVKACDFVHARVASEYFYEVRGMPIGIQTNFADGVFWVGGTGRRLRHPIIQPEPLVLF